MSAELVLTTFDWVPEWPRGYVRDLRGVSRLALRGFDSQRSDEINADSP